MNFFYCRSNHNLSFCDVASICDFIENAGLATISENVEGCNSLSEVVAACLVGGISSMTHDFEYTIFPNPARGELNINAIFKIKTSGSLRLMDGIGRTSYQFEFNNTVINHQIDLTAFVPGIYLLEIRTNRERVIEKVVITE